MIYIVKINYNELGEKLTGKTEYMVKLNLATKPTDDQIKNYVYREVPEQMVANFEFVPDTFATLNAGDLVKLIETKTKTYTVETDINIVKVVEIDDKGIKVENYKNRFDFAGNEISRKKKDIATIELPSQTDIDNYNYQQKRIKLINKLEDLFEEDKYFEIKNEYIEEIIEILTNPNNAIWA